MRATALILLGRFREASGAARRAVELGSRNANEKLAYALLESGEYSQAVLSADEALKVNPENAQVYAIRAYANERLGFKADMLADIKQAAALDRESFSGKLDRALSGGRLFQAKSERAALLAEKEKVSKGLSPAVWAAAAIFVLTCLLFVAYIQFSRKEAAEPASIPSETAAVASFAAGHLLGGKYDLSRVIGKGGMGHVWEATDTTLNRKVAVKKMTAELGELGSTAREYYLKEARTVASLDHPHIIGIYEILDLPDGIYLVFELALGKTVQHILAETKTMSLRKVRDTLRPVCDALEFAHGRGFVHRDLKPANIMITDQGFVKVMDFGIARRIDEMIDPAQVRDVASEVPQGILMAKTRTIVGTPQYMPPEAGLGVVSPLTDVYTLGVCMYEMCTGRMPYGANSDQAKLQRSYARVRDLVPETKEEVERLIYDAVDPDPKTRIQSARVFADRLDNLAALKEG